MPRVLLEAEIAELLAEAKPLSKRYRVLLVPRKGKGGLGNSAEKTRRLNLVGAKGNSFRIWVSVNPLQPNDFSIGLVWIASKTEKHDLVRCNGWHDEHPNKLERIKIPANTCHIHLLTERYQLAKRTSRLGYAVDASGCYGDFKTARDYFCSHFGFYLSGHEYGKDYPLLDNRDPT